MLMTKFSKISQLRGVVQAVKNNAEFTGLDADGEPTYNHAAKKPTLIFHGTVKLHGTNAAVCFHEDQIWVQSRTSIIKVGDDNHGCANFVENTKKYWLRLRDQLRANYDEFNGQVIAIFFEWCGKGIQNKVGITQLEKFAMIYDVKIVNPEDNEENWYVDEGVIWDLKDPDARIFNIYDFATYSIQIDFNEPSEAVQDLQRLTLGVEEECPVAKQLGVTEKCLGEGIVFRHKHPTMGTLRFKCKGEKHQGKEKTKIKIAIAPEVLASIESFVEYSVPPRLEQGISEVFKGQPMDIKQLGQYIKWMSQDILKEELDTLTHSGLLWSQVVKPISNKARQWFLEKYNEL